MPVADSSAIIAFLGDEPARPIVDDLLRHPVDVVHISALNLAEVLDVLARRIGETEIVERQIDLLLHGGLEVVPVDESIALRAGLLRARHYDSRKRHLSMGDCVALSTSQFLASPLVTSDRILADTAIDESMEVIRIPNSAGIVP